jgi:hypothetical protein
MRGLEFAMSFMLMVFVYSMAFAQDLGSTEVPDSATVKLMIEMAITGAGTWLATWIYKTGFRKLKVKISPKSLPWVARGFSVFGLAAWKVFDQGFSWKALGTAAVMGLVAAYGASKSHDIGSTVLAGKK